MKEPDPFPVGFCGKQHLIEGQTSKKIAGEENASTFVIEHTCSAEMTEGGWGKTNDMARRQARPKFFKRTHRLEIRAFQAEKVRQTPGIFGGYDRHLGVSFLKIYMINTILCRAFVGKR